MTERFNPDVSRSHGPLLHGFIFAYAVMIGIESGAAAFVARTVFPLWTESPEAVISWKTGSPFYLEEGTFFMFSSTLTFLLAVATLITSWRAAPQLRRWLRMSTLVFIAIFVWSMLYFVPVQAVMKGDAGALLPREELSSMLSTFVNLNYIRVLGVAFSLITALHALGISYRMKSDT